MGFVVLGVIFVTSRIFPPESAIPSICSRWGSARARCPVGGMDRAMLLCQRSQRRSLSNGCPLAGFYKSKIADIRADSKVHTFIHYCRRGAFGGKKEKSRGCCLLRLMFECDCSSFVFICVASRGQDSGLTERRPTVFGERCGPNVSTANQRCPLESVQCPRIGNRHRDSKETVYSFVIARLFQSVCQHARECSCRHRVFLE